MKFSTTSVPHVFDCAWGSGRPGGPLSSVVYGAYETFELDRADFELQRMISNAKHWRKKERLREKKAA